MFEENEYSILDFVCSISEIVDLISPDLGSHHKKVTYISYHIAKEMNLPDDEVKDIFLASILHDIGAFTSGERTKLKAALFDDSAFNQHAEIGYRLLRKFEPFSNASVIIKHHHSNFKKSEYEIPNGSYIIHLADRLSVLFDEHGEILEQIPKIMKQIDQNQSMFHPGALEALHRLSKLEYFWIEVCSLSMHYNILEKMQFSKQIIDLETLRSFAKVLSHIIDFRSRFTSTHSSGVAAVALELTAIYGFSGRECKMMEIAGFLHDIGKLSVSYDILEKNGALTNEEFNEMRKHTYYTYAVLNKIKGFEQISKWAAYHHERLNGNGYPFHIKGDEFSKMARIMAVADIVTAITEDRPYRLGMKSEEAIKILDDMVKNGAIDEGIVKIVKDNFSRINEVRVKAQQDALQEYIAFSDMLDV